MHLIVVLLLFCSRCASSTSAQVLGSHQLAVGEWRVTLRGRFDPTSIFPKTLSNLPSEIVARRGLWGSRVLDCTFSMSDDGTFCLRPEQSNDNHLPVRGRWNVLSNPYCITDRFYDQLTLKSHPRQHIVNADGEEDAVIDSITAVNVYARMWGHYSRNKPGRGKLSHGSLTVSAEESKHERRRWPVKQSISFSAVKKSSQSKEKDWEDQEYFGY
ncbi:unnamed protein product [Cylindrotheca closterium]|uniref:Uncharacterized protein n=1 Tax=Cylindrotheca closterium TaxID=2856 RepID=A0AAD2CT61_9STRA|nr:unnamed protein product [Cylindrotheca closterium]